MAAFFFLARGSYSAVQQAVYEKRSGGGMGATAPI